MRYAGRFLFLVLLVPLAALHAQTTDLSNGVTLSISPTTPKPGAAVTATLDSNVTDLSQSTITWKVNGSTIASGRGLTTERVTAGTNGALTTVSVSGTAPAGQFSATVSFRPATVDLLWQGSGYTPPFYAGRSLWGRQTQVTFFAVPHVTGAGGREADPSSLTFRWSKNGTILGENSGVGMNSITLADSVLGLPMDVEVEVLLDRDTVVANDTVTLAPLAPSVFVYEDNPIYGYLFNNEGSSSIVMDDREITLSAFPFLFSASAKTGSNISYSWLSNGSNEQTGESIVYRNESGEAGSAVIKASAAHNNFLSQFSSNEFVIQFAQHD